MAPKDTTPSPNVDQSTIKNDAYLGEQEPKAEECSEDSSIEVDFDSNMAASMAMSDDDEKIDHIIVCKIENEFGYPEEFLLDCLKHDRKNDATTCYYLFCKEDKHEIVNLLKTSPKH